MKGRGQTYRCHFPDGSEEICDLHGLAALWHDGVVTIEGRQWLWRITERVERPSRADDGTTVDVDVWVEPLPIPR